MPGKPRFDPERYARYCERLSRVLETRGPLTAAQAARLLGEPLHRVAWFLGQMARDGRSRIAGVARLAENRHRRRPLYATGPQPEEPQPAPPPEPARAAETKAPAIDEADMAWMAYWRGRWERKHQSAHWLKNQVRAA